MKADTTELWDINKVKPYEHNPRKNEKAIAQVAASIREIGFLQPVVVDAEGVLSCSRPVNSTVSASKPSLAKTSST